MMMPNRNYSTTSSYRYGFNGKENDNEVHGEGNQIDYGMRVYDPRIARFLSVDPISKNYPQLTPYQFASNSPIVGSDLDGLEFEDRKGILAGFAELQNANKKSTQQNTQVQQSISVGGLLESLWEGAKEGYRDTKNSLSTQALKNTFNNTVAAAKDFGKSALGDKKAAEDFANRFNNFATGVTNTVAKPIMFFSTMDKRSANENAYGIGYYGFQGVAIYGTDRIFSEIEANREIASPTTLSEKFSSGGTKLVSSEMLKPYASSLTYGDLSGTFITPTSEVNQLLSKGLSRSEIATRLGITNPNFLKGNLIRIDVSPDVLNILNLRRPTGTELGANSQFQIGGKTIGGVTEGVVNGIPKSSTGVKATTIELK